MTRILPRFSLSVTAPWLPLTLFVALTILAAAGLLASIDATGEQLAAASWSPSFGWAAALLSLVASPEGGTMLMLLLAALLWRRRRRASIAFLAVFVAGNLLEILLKHYLAHPGPTIRRNLPSLNSADHGLIHELLALLADVGLTGVGTNSYPSGHMLRSILLLAVLYAAFPYPGVRVLTVLLAIVIAFLLIESGAHLPSDVLGGALAGWGLAALALSVSTARRSPARRRRRTASRPSRA